MSTESRSRDSAGSVVMYGPLHNRAICISFSSNGDARISLSGSTDEPSSPVSMSPSSWPARSSSCFCCVHHSQAILQRHLSGAGHGPPLLPLRDGNRRALSDSLYDSSIILARLMIKASKRYASRTCHECLPCLFPERCCEPGDQGVSPRPLRASLSGRVSPFTASLWLALDTCVQR